MEGKLNPTPRHKPSLEEQAREIASKGSWYGNMGTRFYALRATASGPASWWTDIVQTPTYGEFATEFLRRAGHDPTLPTAVIAASDQDFIKTYDAFAQRVNEAIGTGVTTQEQANRVKEICDEVANYIREYCSTRFGQSGDITGGKEA